MENIKNSQEQNEALDRLHPEYYGQYAIVNVERGIIQWYESHESAVRDIVKTGGCIINTATADPDFVKRTLDAARKNM